MIGQEAVKVEKSKRDNYTVLPPYDTSTSTVQWKENALGAPPDRTQPLIHNDM